MSEWDNNWVRDCIISLRGGIPDKCDYCDKKRKPEELHPDEGGTWSCIYCIEAWEKAEWNKKTPGV